MTRSRSLACTLLITAMATSLLIQPLRPPQMARSALARPSASRLVLADSDAGQVSRNWSGYVLQGSSGAFTSISGQWQVPTVAPTSGTARSSTWIGIDGWPGGKNLVQVGTEQNWIGGKAVYYAWDEILPNGQVRLFTVDPGDVMTASIAKRGGLWEIQIEDITNGAKPNPVIPRQHYYGTGTSAEWVEEATAANSVVSTLANYGIADFDDLTLNGKPARLSPGDRMAMYDKATEISTPSLPNSAGDGFAVAYGGNAPPPPSKGFSFDELTWKGSRLPFIPAANDWPTEYSLDQVSCPNPRVCLADFDGGTLSAPPHQPPEGEVISTSPSQGAASWAFLNPQIALIRATCSAPDVCVGIDPGALLEVTTDPSGGPSAWPTDPQLPPLDGVSCITSKLCFAAGLGSDIYSSTNPTVGAWTQTPISGGSLYEDERISAISCPAMTLCVAVDQAGNVIYSSDPTAASPTWSVANVDGNIAIDEISCPSTKECLALDANGNLFASTNPAGGRGAWKMIKGSSVDPLGILTGISCADAGFCVAVDQSGNVASSAIPTLGLRGWTVVRVDPSQALNAVACPASNLCVAVDSNGDVVTGTSGKGKD